MVENLLEFHLNEMGVTTLQFHEAIASNPSSTLSKQVLEQLLVVDDFLSFKKMMVKRNAELEAEAMSMLQKFQEGGGAADSQPASPPPGGAAPDAALADDFEKQLERAMKLSMAEATTEMGPIGTDDVATAQRAREQAELEMVLALSLQLETAKRSEHDEAVKRQQAEEEAALEAALEASRKEAEAARQAGAFLDAATKKAEPAPSPPPAAPEPVQPPEPTPIAPMARFDAAPLGSPGKPPSGGGGAAAAAAAKADEDASGLVSSVRAARQAAADAAASNEALEPAKVQPAMSAAARAAANVSQSARQHMPTMFVADPRKASETQLNSLKRAEDAARRAEEIRKREQHAQLMGGGGGGARASSMQQSAAMRGPTAGVAASTSMQGGEITDAVRARTRPAHRAVPPPPAQRHGPHPARTVSRPPSLAARARATAQELEVKRRAEHMRRQRELLLLQKRQQAMSAVSASQGAGFKSGPPADGAAAAGGARPGSASLTSTLASGGSGTTHDFLETQRKELEGRLQKSEDAKAAEVTRIQEERKRQQQSLNAMLLKPLM